MTDEQIELHTEIDDAGKVTIKDQHGRTLKGVQRVTLIRAVDDAAKFVCQVLEYRDGKAFIDKAAR